MNQENFFVSPNDLSGRLDTKENLYQILDVDVEYHIFNLDLVGLVLHPYDKWSTSFLRGIFAKKKLVSRW